MVLADGVAHKVVIQVSTDDERTQKIALNNAVNIQKSLGVDEVTIEIVAYGPGLGIMTLAGKQSQRVADLALQDITFSACNNTIKKITKKKGAATRVSRRRHDCGLGRGAHYRTAATGVCVHQTLMQTRPLMPNFGLEVLGVDLSSSMNDDSFAKIRDLYFSHSALLFRGQDLSPASQAILAHRFGRPKIETRKQFNLEAHPEVSTIGNAKHADGQDAAFFVKGGFGWHTDGTSACHVDAGNLSLRG